MKAKNDIEVENRDIFIKLEPSDSVELKKALLEIEASSINMQLIAEKVKEITKQELKERTLAKRSLRESSNMIYELIERLPKSKGMPTIINKPLTEEAKIVSEERKTPKKEQAYEKQLEDLRKRIDDLK